MKINRRLIGERKGSAALGAISGEPGGNSEKTEL